MEDKELQQQLAKRFKELPEKVQNAITSADVQGHLRTLAETHKLHVDQWAILENEVVLTMLGFEKTVDLAKNIAREVGIHEDAAEALASDISKTVFEPIRAELERQAPAPIGVETAEGAIEIREPAAAPAETPRPKAAIAPILAATPPRPAPDTKVARAPISSSYSAAAPSHERKTIEGDPYREQTA